MMLWLIILLVVLVIIVLFVISTYNGLVGARNKVRDQFSQIDVQLKKRFDLIPNLVETVKGYAKHESETFEKVIQARNGYMSAKDDGSKIKAAKDLSSGISKIFALAEGYPELKANTNFTELQKELKDVEEKISYARQFYNDSVLIYNNKIEMFPSNIVASMFHFKKENFFEAEEQEKENVKVKFQDYFFMKVNIEFEIADFNLIWV